jgi:hypothetical protein
VDIESRALDRRTVYRFQLRLALGTVVPAAAPPRIGELAAGVLRAGALLARRAEEVAGTLDRLGERGWRPIAGTWTGRELLAPRVFAGPEGSELPESVTLAREAMPDEVARDLEEAGGDLRAELAENLEVRVDDLEIPAWVGHEEAGLRYSPREYLETFPVQA